MILYIVIGGIYVYHLTSKLIIYRNIDRDSILFRLADIYRSLQSGSYETEALSERVLEEIHRLLDVATKYGFDGNLWHNYLAFLLATTEAPFTLVCEKTGGSDGSVNAFAKNDLEIFRQLFSYDFSPLEKALDLINEIKASMPSALAEAKRLVAARDEFIGNAKKEAESLRKSSEEKARSMIEEQEIIRIARSRSAEMISNAEAKSAELRRVAGDYVDDVMRQAEESLRNSLETIQSAHSAVRTANGTRPAAASITFCLTAR